MPYAFTEQGVAMLSGILNSDRAINMNIAIMRAFVEVRKVLLRQNDLKEQMKQIKAHLGEHDAQLNQIYDAMENLLDEKAAQRNWNDQVVILFLQKTLKIFPLSKLTFLLALPNKSIVNFMCPMLKTLVSIPQNKKPGKINTSPGFKKK